MSQKTCKYKFIIGKRKGEVCGRFCRSGKNICSEHQRRQPNHKSCKYKFLAGTKKGTVCGRYCRNKMDRCSEHSLCEHDKLKKSCPLCWGKSTICIHNRKRQHCKSCKGASICKHDKVRSVCKQCKGGSICKHNKVRSTCKQCKGSRYCVHNKIKSRCRKCDGSEICPHNTRKNICYDCDPIGHLSHVMRSRVQNSLKENKDNSSKEYLGCEINELKTHLEKLFEEGMSWENYGEWEIDHIVPLKYRNPTIEEVGERLHYSNTQPMWKTENMSKGNRYIGKPKRKQVKKKYSGSKSTKYHP